MYRFDPSLLQVALASVAMLCGGFLAAWAVVRGEAGGRAGEGEAEGKAPGTGGSGGGTGGRGAATDADGDELSTRQKVILWTAAGAAALFLLWWATLSTGSGGAPRPL